MSGLPRELLKWLQSLDLTYSVKNVKRDFSNGFLVAEIFSRYYSADVQMHSYDNGHSLQRKLDNWAQLNKFFTRRGFLNELPKELIQDTIHCKNIEAPTRLLASIYSLLTQREVKLFAAASDAAAPGSDPAYTKANATSLLNSQIRDSELHTTLSDQSAAAARAKALIDEHTEGLRDARGDESRYAMPPGATTSAAASMTAGMLRGPPKPVSESIEAAQVRFQEVKVTAVDRNIAQLRAKRDEALSGGPSIMSDRLAGGGGAVPYDGGAAGGGLPPAPGQGGEGRMAIGDYLSSTVLPKCPYIAASFGPTASFADVLSQLPMLPKTEASEMLLVAFAEAGEEIALAMKKAPANGWELFALFAPALAAARDATLLVDFLVNVCTRLAILDASAAYEVLANYAVPFLLPLLQPSADKAKKAALLTLVYSLVPARPEKHIDAIRVLQDCVNDQAAFLQLLPTLISMEGASGFSNDLVSLYVYYCVLALDTTGPRLKSDALGMLVTIASHEPAPIKPLFNKLHSLGEEQWWEVQAQLGRLCGVLLTSPAAALDPEEEATVVAIFARALANRSPSAMALLVSAAAPCLGAYPALTPPFCEALVGLPPPLLKQLLTGGGLAVETAVGGALLADPVCEYWPALSVATCMMSIARDLKLNALEPAYADVLSAIVLSTPNALEAEAVDEWKTFLFENKDYLYVGLADEEICLTLTSALLPLFAFLVEKALPTFSTLLASVRIVCDKAPQCTTCTSDFLCAVYDLGGPFPNAVEMIVKDLEAETAMVAKMGAVIAKVRG